jgi:Tfp pilus assembly protein PilF
MRLAAAWRLALVCVMTTTAAGTAGAAPWVRVRSPHFIVSGNVGEARARDVATRFEQFREVLLRIFPSARLALRPIPVVAFDSDKAFTPYKLREGNKVRPVAGYFSGTSDGACIALQLDRGEESYPIIFHEFTHLFLSERARRLPQWLGEGLAEYYSTVALEDRGLTANVGKPIPHHVRLIRDRFMPLRDLLTVGRESKVWTDADEGALYYAEAWTLVHWVASAPDGAARFAALTSRLAAGRGDIEAFEEVFGPIDKVEFALKNYARGSIFRFRQYTFSSEVSASRSPARPLTAPEVDATLGTLLTFVHRFDEAERHLAAALAAAPDLAEAHAARGFLALQQQRPNEAEPELRTAVASAPGDLDAAYLWGLALIESTAGRDVSPAQAEAALRAALPASDPPADALGVLGALQAQSGRLAEAEATLRLSMDLAPGRPRTTFALADVLIRAGKYDAGRAILGPAIARPAYPGQEEIARQLLKWLVREEALAKERAELERLSGTPPTTADANRPRPTGLRPSYRTTGAGEQRQAGVLQQIECGRLGQVLVLDTTAGAMRFHFARFEDVEFVTYRDDLGGSVSCGPRKNREPVYITWKAAGALPASLGAIAGTAVAVEFLPK